MKTLRLLLVLLIPTSSLLAQDCYYGKCSYDCIKGGCLTIKEVRKSIGYHQECQNYFMAEYMKKQRKIKKNNIKNYSGTDISKYKKLVLRDLENQKNLLHNSGVDVSNSNIIDEIKEILKGFNRLEVINETGILGLFASDGAVTLSSTSNINNGTNKIRYTFSVNPNTNEWIISADDRINFSKSNPPKYTNFYWTMKKNREGWILMETRLRSVLSGTGGKRNWKTALKVDYKVGRRQSRHSPKPEIVVKTRYAGSIGNDKVLVFDPILQVVRKSNMAKKSLTKSLGSTRVTFLYNSFLLLDPSLSTQLHLIHYSWAVSGFNGAAKPFTCISHDNGELTDSWRSASQSEIDDLKTTINSNNIKCEHKKDFINLFEYYYRSSLFIKDYFDNTPDYSSVLASFSNPKGIGGIVESRNPRNKVIPGRYQESKAKKEVKSSNNSTTETKKSRVNKNLSSNLLLINPYSSKTSVEELNKLLECNGVNSIFIDQNYRWRLYMPTTDGGSGPKITEEEYRKNESKYARYTSKRIYKKRIKFKNSDCNNSIPFWVRREIDYYGWGDLDNDKSQNKSYYFLNNLGKNLKTLVDIKKLEEKGISVEHIRLVKKNSIVIKLNKKITDSQESHIIPIIKKEFDVNWKKNYNFNNLIFIYHYELY